MASRVQPMIDSGTLTFSIESRLLRELGERLVKEPEVAVLELIKNAYDADALLCSLDYDAGASITVADDGHGMTLDDFTTKWMRIGTSSRASSTYSDKYCRLITGEKGIGRLAVRFLGRALQLETVADDAARGVRTRLTAEFDWPSFDRREDLGKVDVPYELFEADEATPTGTKLVVTQLRAETDQLELKSVRTGSIGMLTPLGPLFRTTMDSSAAEIADKLSDPGFVLSIRTGDDDPSDVAAEILDAFVLKAKLSLRGDRVRLRVFPRGSRKPRLKIVDTYPNDIRKLDADIRFFPRRHGTFTGLTVDGRRAQGWVTENHGVAVFDRRFRVAPYGNPGDDWLQLQADAARNRRDPRSSLADKHFPMSRAVRAAPGQNWMIRLPQSAQLIGLVELEGRRIEQSDRDRHGEGLVAAADREGFVKNSAFEQLWDLVRGAVEAIAYADRQMQIEEEEAERTRREKELQEETRAAIAEIQANPDIATPDKARIVSMLSRTARLSLEQQETARERERQLEVMSLLGIVAGFMTHEFGIAIQELEAAHKDLLAMARRSPKAYESTAARFADHIDKLREFVTYSSGYIRGSRSMPPKPYAVKPRLRQVKRIFGSYAHQRDIAVEISVESDITAPPVPVSLYNGVALNLYTNALKAVAARASTPGGRIAFRAWNDERWHWLEVSDTGIGIPAALRERVFDPLVTTTQSRPDPLGSGMGLGLALVRRGVAAFGGKVEIVEPPGGFATCIRVRLPLTSKESRK